MTRTPIRDRVENWGRYWRDTSGAFGRCRSIEHRYVPPPGAAFDAEERQARVTMPPDMADAIIINEAWKRASRPTKDLLKWTFALSFRPFTNDRDFEKVCSRCGFAADLSLFTVRMYKAMREIERIVDMPAGIGISSAQIQRSSRVSDTPVQSATERPSVVRSTAKEPEAHD